MRGPMAVVRRKYGLEFKTDAVARMMVCEDVKALAAAVSADRIAELERLLGRKQLELDFFKQAFDHVRGVAGKNTTDGATPFIAASTRRARSKED